MPRIPKNILLAKTLYDALKGSDPGAFIQGDVKEMVIDGRFDLVHVADQLLEAIHAAASPNPRL